MARGKHEVIHCTALHFVISERESELDFVLYELEMFWNGLIGEQWRCQGVIYWCIANANGKNQFA